MATITLEEVYNFHCVDRNLFSKLVIKLKRNVAQSLLVMALWLWLEDEGHPSIIKKLVAVPPSMINAVADEAASVLRCLETRAPTPVPSNGGLPLTARLMDNQISLQTFNQIKFTTITGIKYFLTTVCNRIFTDILQTVLGSSSSSSSSSSPFFAARQSLNNSLVIPGFPHPVFGNPTVILRPLDYCIPTGELWGWNRTGDIPADDRTMFLTFSRGFTVTEAEVRQVFTRIFGDCIDTIEMEQVPSSEQPLYAQMVLCSVTTIDKILNGEPIAKFKIKGKHIWARKYEKRENPR